MSTSISSALSIASVAAANSDTTSATAQKTQQPAVQQSATQQGATQASDTVKLSESQQVYQLHDQGQPVSQIASNLSLTVTAVNSYLGNSGSTG